MIYIHKDVIYETIGGSWYYTIAHYLRKKRVPYKVVNGHNMKAIRKSLKVDKTVLNEKQLCLVLDTIKGKGVSFMEDPSWHCKVPTDKEYKQAMKELGV